MEIKKSQISQNITQINDNKSYNELYLRRDSFSDRFCDHLCEVIVSYLSFEDKIRFECVSHQFQRLLFNKQYVLEINDSRLKTQNGLNQMLTYSKTNSKSEFGDIVIDSIAFESLIKKFKFINKMVFNTEDIECENRGKVLQLIAEYVKHLKSIEFDFKDINEKVLLQFGEKCGQKLENIKFLNFNKFHRNDYKLLLKLCPNIRSLTNIRLEDIIENNDLLVPKLMSVKELDIICDNTLFETFINKTKNALKCLGITTECYSHYSGINVYKKLSNFVDLTEMRLMIHKRYKSENIEHILHNIGIKCKKITKLYVYINKWTDDPFLAKKSAIFQPFTQLKHLRLNFMDDLTLKSLKDCKLLTHLSICLESDIEYEFNSMFTDFDVYLSQLTHLYISFNWFITDDELKTFAKLSHLKCLIIGDSVCHLTDEAICEIINNCPQIKSILFYQIPKITHKTIDALISLAEKKSYCDYVFSFGSKPFSEEAFDLLQFLTDNNYKFESLPKNLHFIHFHKFYEYYD